MTAPVPAARAGTPRAGYVRPASSPAPPGVRRAAVAARVLLGLVFLVEGADGFLHVLPPWPSTPEGGRFIGALVGSGYLWPLLKLTEAACGLALVAGRFVPLALVVLAPVLVNVVGFQAALGVGWVLAFDLALLVPYGFLVWAYRRSFRGVLAAQPPVAGP